MSKLTVKQYADLNKVSVQSVYKRLKIGTLEYIEINNIKYIVVDDIIDYEKKFHELQPKYEALLTLLEVKNELIEQLKDKQRLFNMLLPNTGVIDSIEVKDTKYIDKQKKKERKSKKKKKDKK
jgi:hypothetical protein